MPYQNEKQRRYMYAKHPGIAKKWDAEGKNYVSKSYKHHKYGKKGK